MDKSAAGELTPTDLDTPSTLGFSWPLITALLALIVIATKFSNIIIAVDGDTFWHIAAGQWIIDNKAIPTVDMFSFSAAGKAWTAHEWLAEVIFASVHRIAGWEGLAMMTLAVYALMLARMTRFLLARMEPVHAILMVVFVIGMSLGLIAARPHVLAWAILVLWMTELVDANESNRPPPLWLIPAMAIWANLHGSFVLGVLLSLAVGFEAVWNANPAVRMKTAKLWLRFVALAALASMATPSGWHGWEFTFQVLKMKYALAVIGEWASPDFHEIQPLELWLAIVLAAALVGRLKLPWVRLVLVIMLIHLALKHQRNVAILAFASIPLMARPWAQQWYGTGSKAKDAESIDRVFRALAQPARPLTVLLGSAGALALVWSNWLMNPIAPRKEFAPSAAIAAVKSAHVDGPVLNDYGLGGYLIYSGIKVYIDGRADMYGDDFLKNYRDAISLKEPAGLTKILADQKIQWTILTPETPAVAVLDLLPEWKRLYADDTAVVHVRTKRVD